MTLLLKMKGEHGTGGFFVGQTPPSGSCIEALRIQQCFDKVVSQHLAYLAKIGRGQPSVFAGTTGSLLIVFLCVTLYKVHPLHRI